MGGTVSYRKAVAEYYLNRFEVALDPQSEVLALVGSKEGLFNLCQVMLNPGDISLGAGPRLSRVSQRQHHRRSRSLPMPLLKEEHAFLPDLDAIPAGYRPARETALAQLSQQPHRRDRPLRILSKSG